MMTSRPERPTVTAEPCRPFAASTRPASARIDSSTRTEIARVTANAVPLRRTWTARSEWLPTVTPRPTVAIAPPPFSLLALRHRGERPRHLGLREEGLQPLAGLLDAPRHLFRLRAVARVLEVAEPPR